MITIILIFTLLNTVMIIGGGLFYFHNNYTIVDLETYNELVRTYNEVVEEAQATEEKPGGCGFFQEYLDDEPIEEEDE
mgnify:FL=1